jgi:hypothetical protein
MANAAAAIAITFTAVAKFGNATTSFANAAAKAAIELVPAIAKGKAEDVLAIAKRDFGYDKRDDKGKASWRTFAKKASAVGTRWSEVPSELQTEFLKGTRGASLDSVYKALTSEEAKAKAEAGKAERTAKRESEDAALVASIVEAGKGGKFLTPGEVLAAAAAILHEGGAAEFANEAFELFEAVAKVRAAMVEDARKAA